MSFGLQYLRTEHPTLLLCSHGVYRSEYDIVETARKLVFAKVSIRKLGSSSVLMISSLVLMISSLVLIFLSSNIVSIDEDPSLRIVSFAIMELIIYEVFAQHYYQVVGQSTLAGEMVRPLP